MNIDGLAVILGNPRSLFLRELASCWRSRGMEVAIVTHHSHGPRILSNGTRLISSEAYETTALRVQLRLLERLLRRAQKVERIVERERFSRAMGAERDYKPSFVTPVTSGISIAHCIRYLRPRFVFGQEAFAFGLATALCQGVPRILMPWGGDVYMYAETSFLSFLMVKYALQHVDLICPGSIVAARHIVGRYGVSPAKVQAVSWGVDRKMFKRAGQEQRSRVCLRYGIQPDKTIFLNARRFLPAWGCEVALRAFAQFAQESPTAHFVMLGGVGTEWHVGAARQQLKQMGLEHRFTLFEGDLPLSECADVMSVSDVFVSLMLERDMRSWSILQACSAGGAPILSDQQEYREMERLGFRALFVDPTDLSGVLGALRAYATDSALRSRDVSRNQSYLSEFEDEERQMTTLLHMIDGVCHSQGRLARHRQ